MTSALLGWAGASLVVGSLGFRSMLWLRLVGITGALVFWSYGVSIGSGPIIATNTCTASLHAMHLFSMLEAWESRKEIS